MSPFCSVVQSHEVPRPRYDYKSQMGRKNKAQSYQEDNIAAQNRSSGYQIMKNNVNREDVERLLRYFSTFPSRIPDLNNILRSRCFSERVVTRLDSEDDHFRLENRSSSGYQTRAEDRDERGEWDEEVFTEATSARSRQHRSHHHVPS